MLKEKDKLLKFENSKMLKVFEKHNELRYEPGKLNNQVSSVKVY